VEVCAVEHKVRWWPRHGQPLTEKRGAGRIELLAFALITEMPKVFLYAPVALLIAWLIAFTGRGELVLRSYGVLAIAVWLAVDLWAYLVKRSWRWRFVVGWTGTNVLLILAMLTMWWLLDDRLQDERKDVFQHLSFSHYIRSGEEDDPMSTIFTATNGSSYAISYNNLIGCEVILAVGTHGQTFVQNIGRPAYANPDNGHIVISRAGEHPQISHGSSLKPGNDAESEKCLSWFELQDATECVDVKVIFWYALADQPETHQEKKIRYVANKGKDNHFSWLQQPVDSSKSYCMSFYKGHSGITVNDMTTVSPQQ
jgi:hypothetical protein